MLTMLLGGLWHGASWSFVVWGGMHGTGLVYERWRRERGERRRLSRSRATRRRASPGRARGSPTTGRRLWPAGVLLAAAHTRAQGSAAPVARRRPLGDRRARRAAEPSRPCAAVPGDLPVRLPRLGVLPRPSVEDALTRAVAHHPPGAVAAGHPAGARGHRRRAVDPGDPLLVLAVGPAGLSAPFRSWCRASSSARSSSSSPPWSPTRESPRSSTSGSRPMTPRDSSDVEPDAGRRRPDVDFIDAGRSTRLPGQR